MGRGGQRHGQTSLNRHTLIEANGLESNLALIVVHRDNAVEIPLLGSHEGGVRREGTLHINTIKLGEFHPRGNMVNFFPAELPGFSTVRVERAYRDTRFFYSDALNNIVEKVNGIANRSGVNTGGYLRDSTMRSTREVVSPGMKLSSEVKPS